MEEEQASLHKPIPSALEFGAFVIPFMEKPSLHFNQVFCLASTQTSREASFCKLHKDMDSLLP